jgi:catechol 2,3-dioxygenase-like lactoylglutathione lyase family enzyme
MAQILGLVTLVVRDYDEALAFYVETRGFHLVEDFARASGSSRLTTTSSPRMNLPRWHQSSSGR